jgi:hypothetical protein
MQKGERCIQLFIILTTVYLRKKQGNWHSPLRKHVIWQAGMPYLQDQALSLSGNLLLTIQGQMQLLHRDFRTV